MSSTHDEKIDSKTVLFIQSYDNLIVTGEVEKKTHYSHYGCCVFTLDQVTARVHRKQLFSMCPIHTTTLENYRKYCIRWLFSTKSAQIELHLSNGNLAMRGLKEL